MIKKFLIVSFCFYLKADFISEYSRDWMGQSVALAGSFKNIGRSDLHKAMNSIKSYCVWYKIRKNKITVKNVSQNIWVFAHRRDAFTNILTDLASNVTLPDVEFIVDMGDMLSNNVPESVPVFAYCKREDQAGFLVPDSEFTGLSKKQNHFEEIAAQLSYEQKIPKLIWRGTTTGGDWNVETIVQAPRYNLVKASLENHIIDACFNNCCQRDKALERKLTDGGFISGWMTVEDQMRYRYQILVDGNSATWCRTYWQLFSGSLIFKQKSPWLIYIHYALKPGVHYVELQNDLSDTVDKLNWAMQHEDEAKAIVRNTLEFAKDNATYNHLLAYTYHVLVEYKKYWNR